MGTKEGRYLDQNEWNHLHDIVYDISSVDLDKASLELLFNELPDEIKIDVYAYGLNDTVVRDSIGVWYKNKLEENNPIKAENIESLLMNFLESKSIDNVTQLWSYCKDFAKENDLNMSGKFASFRPYVDVSFLIKNQIIKFTINLSQFSHVNS